MTAPAELTRLLNFELRQALRRIAARPAHSALVVLVLTAGLASALSVASFMNSLVLNPLPFEDSESLYRAGLIDGDADASDEHFDAPAANDILDWSQQLEGLAEVAAYTQLTLNLSGDGQPERYAGALISAQLLPNLRVAPQLGRGFSTADMQPGAPEVVLLSDAVWRQRFNADPQVLGRSLRVNARPATVIGVMPPDFHFPMREKLWQPLRLQRGERNGDCCYEVLLRLLPGVNATDVRGALEAWRTRQAELEPAATRARARAIGFDQLKYQFVDRGSLRLFGVMALCVLLVLLIACANVANLLLGSQLARERELALRTALGASRGRLMLAAFLHSGLLSLLATLLALPLAQLGVDADVADLRSSVDQGPPLWMQFGIDGRLLLIAAGVALLSALLAGALPALHASRRHDLALRSSGQGGGRLVGVGQWLMMGQVALSLALLMATALLVQIVRQLDHFDLGLDTRQVLTARIGLMPQHLHAPDASERFAERLLEALRAEPAVAAASVSTALPGLMAGNEDVIELGTPIPEQGTTSPGISAVDPGFFEAMGAQRVAGRLFSAADRADSEPVMVVDETFVEQFGLGERALGSRFVLNPEGSTPRTVTIVGVVRPIQLDDIDGPREASMFLPFAQRPQRFFNVLVRTRGEPLAYSNRLREIAHALEPDSPLYWMRDYSEVLREATLGQRVLARVFSTFGGVALVLAAAGLFGVVALTVQRRTREIGIRRALGAAGLKLLSAVLGRTLLKLSIGLALGLGLGLALVRLLDAQLGSIGMQGGEPGAAIWLPALLVLSLAAALACWLPLKRALAIEPTRALRED
jgi:putative ABC transport system permease protein